MLLRTMTQKPHQSESAARLAIRKESPRPAVAHKLLRKASSVAQERSVAAAAASLAELAPPTPNSKGPNALYPGSRSSSPGIERASGDGADMATVEAVRPAEPTASHQSSVGMFASYANLADLQDEEACIPGEGTEEPEASTSDGVPVFVMMPLDTVNSEGVFRYASSKWFTQALKTLVGSGVHGIAVDVWWGAVERHPRRYDWSGYRRLFELSRSMGLRVQAVLSFHACGGNVGDSAQIPLPRWVLQVGEQDPDLFFTDRPRGGALGQRNREYLSIFADDAPRALQGRTPLEAYTDFMRAFRDAFLADLGECIEEVVVGAGPCGELRYPSYPEPNGWRFPGVYAV